MPERSIFQYGDDNLENDITSFEIASVTGAILWGASLIRNDMEAMDFGAGPVLLVSHIIPRV